MNLFCQKYLVQLCSYSFVSLHFSDRNQTSIFGYKFRPKMGRNNFRSGTIRRTMSDGVLELRMIDFQECMVTRPNADLACLVLNSVLPQDREDHLRSWMRLYHDELNRLLLKFGYHDCRETYTLEYLWQDSERPKKSNFRYQQNLTSAKYYFNTKCQKKNSVFVAIWRFSRSYFG